jgi:hypothetical protein
MGGPGAGDERKPVSSNNSSSSSGGIGFAGLLTIVFVTLKLIHKIAWSWWWVLSPMWIGAAFAVLTLLVLGAVAFTVSRAGRSRRQRARYR